MTKQANYMTYKTAEWLFNKCYSKQGKIIKPSYKDDIYKLHTVDQLKAFIWNKCKHHVVNIESFKKGQRGVDYQAILDLIKEDKQALIWPAGDQKRGNAIDSTEDDAKPL